MTHFPYKSIYSRPNSFTILWRAREILCKCRLLPDCRGDAGSYSWVSLCMNCGASTRSLCADSDCCINGDTL